MQTNSEINMKSDQNMKAYERQKRWVLSTRRHTTVKVREVIDNNNQPSVDEVAISEIYSLRRASNSWNLTNSNLLSLFNTLDSLEKYSLSSKKRDDESQALLKEMGSLVREQKRRMVELEAKIEKQTVDHQHQLKERLELQLEQQQQQHEAEIKKLKEKMKDAKIEAEEKEEQKRKEKAIPPISNALTPSRNTIVATPSTKPTQTSNSSASSSSSLLLQLQAEQESVKFWKRRCKTKDTLILRLQGIVNEQKNLLSTTGSTEGLGRYRTRKSSSDKRNDDNSEKDEEENQTSDYRENYRRERRSEMRSDRERNDINRSNNPSRFLLDLPSGVSGNVELNLSWPPSSSSIDSAEEDDEEIDEVGGSTLTVIQEEKEEEEEEEEEEQESDVGEKKEEQEQEVEILGIDQLHPAAASTKQENEENDHSGSSSSSSSLEVSRSINSDDSGILFDRYL